MQTKRYVRAFAALLYFLLGTVLLVPGTVFGQQTTIEGTVTGAEDGEPISAVNIIVPELGPQFGTATTQEGEYSLEVPARQVRGQTVEVVARFVGFENARKEIELTAGTIELNFELDRDVLKEDEVVVTGVSEATELEQVPFSVNTLSEEEITSVPSSTNPAEAIQGRVPGAQVLSDAGTPGENSSITLRGRSSITGNNSPLYIVDGAVMDGLQDLDALNVKDIEVIKGSAAASIYGSRAQGGVIRITTKSGEDLGLGQSRINFRSMVGFNQLNAPPQRSRNHARQIARTSFVDPNGNEIEAGDFVQNCPNQSGLCKGTFNNANPDFERLSPPGSGESNSVRFMDNPYPTYNEHMDDLFELGAFRRSSGSVSQRSEDTNFRVSLGTVKEQGPIRGARGFRRYNGRFNINHDVTDALSVSARTFFTNSSRDDVTAMGGSSSLWPAIYFTSPAVDLTEKNEDGQFRPNPDSTNRYENPLYTINNRTWNQRRTRYSGTARVDYQARPWLSFRGQLSARAFDGDFREFVDKGFQTAQPDESLNDGLLERDNSRTRRWQGQLRATASRQFFGGLNTRTQIRVRAERQTYESFSASANGLKTKGVRSFGNIEDDPEEDDISAGNFNADTRRAAGFLQTDIDYRGRYIASALVRRDGTSRFGADERWQSYYRLSGAYRPTSEPWWPLDEAVNELKLRYSYGTGGGEPSFTEKFETYNTAGGRINKGQLGNEELEPSFQVEQEVGVNFTLFNRVEGEFTYATSRVEDQILDVPLPGFAGFNQQVQNAGEVESYSVEGGLNATVLNQKDLSLTIGGTITHTRSRITEFDRTAFRTGQDNRTLYKEGILFGKILGNKYIRDKSNLPEDLQDLSNQFQVNDEGFVVAVGQGNSWKDGIRKGLWGSEIDIDGDGAADFEFGEPIKAEPPEGQNQSFIADTNPDFTYGITTNLSWKNLTVRALLGGQYGGDIYNFNRHWAGNSHRQTDQKGRSIEKKKPTLYYGYFDAWNNRYVEDGTYLKLRELSIDYTFTNQSLERAFGGSYGISNITVGVVGNDLLTFTEYSGWDPEVGSGRGGGDPQSVRIDYFRYPNFRSFQVNLEINF